MLENRLNGTVIRSTGSWYSVRLDDGEVVDCRLRGRIRTKGLKATNPVTVGDRVEVIGLEADEAPMISSIGPRKNYIIRRSVNLSKVSHIIASNIDFAIVVASLTSPRTSTGFIDRFLVTAQMYEIPAAIIFNKVDLYSEKLLQVVQELMEVYCGIGYKCLLTSAVTKEGVDELKNLMKDKVSLFSGHSGVGKSALVNCIEPGLHLKVGKISQVHFKGKHTTTFAEMHPLSFGGYIIDTPGIKEFGLIDLDKSELYMYFPEMLSLGRECQFYNCTHDHEPGCAIKKGVETGDISTERYRNYLNLLSGEDLETDAWELK